MTESPSQRRSRLVSPFTKTTRWLLAIALLGLTSAAQAAPSVKIFAAASLTDALNAAIERYQANRDVDIVPVYAASSTAARQVANGAPADLYFSANEQWMDWLGEQGITLAARQDLLRNRLVLIAPSDSNARAVTPNAGQPLSALLGDDQRLAVGDPDHVPAGIYAKQALRSLGQWQVLEARLARADNVRAALALVERGEAPLGIVYQTDVKASDRVRQLGVFPIDSHKPINYPLALVNPPASDAAQAFRQWLASDDSLMIFRRFGFSPLE